VSESLSSRVKRLVSGTANSIVSSVEAMAPEIVMQEAIREMDRAIDDVRVELGQVLTRQHHASRRLAAEDRRHGELKEQVRIALAEGRDDLAEAGVERLLDIEAQIPVLQEAIAETREAQAELEGYVAALQARKREMQHDLKEFRASRSEAAAASAEPGGSAGSGDVARRVDRAGAAFDRVMETAGGIASGAAAPDRKSAAAQAELEALARRNRVRERLAALKGES
jgi:phage shock protein A